MLRLSLSPRRNASRLALLCVVSCHAWVGGSAHARPIVRVKCSATVELEAKRTLGDVVVVAGSLRDGLGAPLPHAELRVQACHGNSEGQARTSVLRTAPDGRFRADLGPLPGTCRVRAAFPGDAFCAGAESTVMPSLPASELRPGPDAERVDRAADSARGGAEGSPAERWSPGPYWLLAPIALCAVLVVAVMRRAGRLTRHSTQIESAPEPRAGLEPVNPRALLPHLQTDIGGQVRDLHSDDPVPRARIELIGDAPAGPIALEASENGDFRCRSLRPGQWEVRASAGGYVEARDRIRIPHRGEWAHMRIRLETLRWRALKPYRAVAQALLPGGHLWNIWTPRETLANATGSRALLASLGGLTELIERACYDRRPPTAQEIEAIERRAASTAEQLQKTDPSPLPPHRR